MIADRYEGEVNQREDGEEKGEEEEKGEDGKEREREAS